MSEQESDIMELAGWENTKADALAEKCLAELGEGL